MQLQACWPRGSPIRAQRLPGVGRAALRRKTPLYACLEGQARVIVKPVNQKRPPAHSPAPQPATLAQGARTVHPRPQTAASPGGRRALRCLRHVPANAAQSPPHRPAGATSQFCGTCSESWRRLAMPNRCALGVAHISSAKRMGQAVTKRTPMRQDRRGAALC
jgi:hypothetical protein